MSRKTEKIWNQYVRSVGLMYAAMLITLHREYGFGDKRLREFEQKFGDTIDKVLEHVDDDVLRERLEEEADSMGRSLNELMCFGTKKITLRDVELQDKAKKKMTMAECAKAAELLKDDEFFRRGGIGA